MLGRNGCPDCSAGGPGLVQLPLGGGTERGGSGVCEVPSWGGGWTGQQYPLGLANRFPLLTGHSAINSTQDEAIIKRQAVRFLQEEHFLALPGLASTFLFDFPIKTSLSTSLLLPFGDQLLGGSDFIS